MREERKRGESFVPPVSLLGSPSAEVETACDEQEFPDVRRSDLGNPRSEKCQERKRPNASRRETEGISLIHARRYLASADLTFGIT